MLEDGADFYIADCPFSDLKEQLSYQLKKEYKMIPTLLIPIADFILRLREKYSIRHVSPVSVIENIKHPILFIHSEKDDFILPSMTEELYKKKQGPKMLYLAANGRHAQSFNENPEEYRSALDKFLSKYVEKA
jgi:uncharacterized protein